MKKFRNCRYALFLLLFSLFAFAPVSFATGLNSYGLQSDNPYLVQQIVQNGQTIDEVIFPGRPPELYRAPLAYIPESNFAAGTLTLCNVPAFDWSYGCSATSAAMLAGYYDNTGYPNMYTGPANGGVCPMDNSGWGSEECPLSATRLGLDGRTIKGHVDDYWIAYGSPAADPFINNWTEHDHGDCTGDYMGTNQSLKNNEDGATSIYFYIDGTPLYDYDGQEPSGRDGCHGVKLFMESRGYNVESNYSQYIYGYNGNTKGFTFAQYKAEIDAGRPVLIHLVGHTMLGYGYNDSGSIVYLHDTWDYGNHSMNWGGSYEDLNHVGVTVVVLTPLEFDPVLFVEPDSRNVSRDAGTTSFNVFNAGEGTMTWTAAVTSGDEWLSITSGASGTDYGVIDCTYSSNTGALSRTGSIQITSSGVTGSPVDVTVIQTGVSSVISGNITSSGGALPNVAITFSNNGGTATTDASGNYSIVEAYGYSGTATPSKAGYVFSPATKTYSNLTENKSGEDYIATLAAQIVVDPASRNVITYVGTTSFEVSNAGNGTLNWTASVTSGNDWLSITSGSTGTNTGTVSCSYSANSGTSSRTATIEISAAEASNSPQTVTLTQAGNSGGGGGGGGGGGTVLPVLSVSPTNRDVANESDTTTFSVSNAGSGTMSWTATVTSGEDWLRIASGDSGTDSGTITAEFDVNTGIESRTGTIRIMAGDATGSPTDVTVTQVGTPAQPVLSVSPASQTVSENSGTLQFNVSNTGTGTLNWTASVVAGSSWMRITSGSSGTDKGIITCLFDANPNQSKRSGKIRITATGATNSPKDVTVTQTENWPPTGEEPDLVELGISPDQVIKLMINSTNIHEDIPVYEWLVFTAVISGNPIPLYVISDIGIFSVDDIIDNLANYTFTFDSDGLTSIAVLSMSDLGLAAGDSFSYGYAYLNSIGIIIMDNIVIIAIE